MSPVANISARITVSVRDLTGVLAGLVLAILVSVPSMIRGSDYNSHAIIAEGSPDAVFVEEIERRSLVYFIEQSDPATGLTQDRASANGSARGKHPASIAATGFALTAWCIADARGWLPRGEACERARRTLRFVNDHVAQERGWIYHFIDATTGERAWHSEASTIDTALFLKGALAAREYFDDPEIRQLADGIYARIDWQWAMHGGKTLTHGWRPETGFIADRWDSYAELLGLYLLGIGAPSHPLPPESWTAWRRSPVVNYGGRTFLDCGPLFTHQYSHAWFDFRGQNDGQTDYWNNSVDATLAQREWSGKQSNKYAQWSQNLWGLTASDSVRGYVAWGGPGGTASAKVDGTVVPCAPAGSIPFAPRECVAALRQMRAVGGDKVWCRYGFVDAFNPQTGWVSSDVIGIDVGITLLMVENARSGLVWRIFMKAPEARLGMWLAGFRSESPSNLTLTAHIAAVE
jgi:hypothetical protein